MEEATLIEAYEFHSPINMEGSWGSRPVAKRAKSTMHLYYYKDNTGFIEWEVPHYGLYENIGLVFAISPEGKRTLEDYDGVMTLPDEAMDLLEKHGVDCAEMRRSMAA